MSRKTYAFFSRSLLVFLVAVCLMSAVWPADGAAVSLEQPIACEIGQNCFIQNYVDMAPGTDYADRSCGFLTYDKHKGTDFRISYKQMLEGVAVKAAAPGVVKGARDGVADIRIRQGGMEAVKDRECGNGVLLVHADGSQTQYCHMRKDSLRVRVGQQVRAGEELGLVGLSGQTEFPHLHFQVRQVDGRYVDPFTGKPMESGCSRSEGQPLWSAKALAAMPYRDSGALEAGFSAEQPDINSVFLRADAPTSLPVDAPLVIFWAGFWGVHKDDTITLRIVSPTGEVWTAAPQVVPRNQAQRLAYIGRKHSGPWPAGVYVGEAVLAHQGTVLASIKRSVTVGPLAPRQ